MCPFFFLCAILPRALLAYIHKSYHLTLGFGSPTNRHSKVMVLPSSDCLITGRSVNVGLIPSSGTGASSPMLAQTIDIVENCSYIVLLAYTESFRCERQEKKKNKLSDTIFGIYHLPRLFWLRERERQIIDETKLFRWVSTTDNQHYDN